MVESPIDEADVEVYSCTELLNVDPEARRIVPEDVDAEAVQESMSERTRAAFTENTLEEAADHGIELEALLTATELLAD